jgi:glucuronate isomerase
MPTFLGAEYLLESASAKNIFDQIKDLPILDAHNHTSVKEIAENSNYEDIWRVEAATDHYVWELMRKRGVPEKLITGSATNYEKWMALSEVFEDFAGNPVYEWIHLDLKNRFGIAKPINSENSQAIWDETLEALALPEMKPQALLQAMNVEVMCSTDDPLDDLADHAALAGVEGIPKVLPTWRPDKAANIFKPDFPGYIAKLAEKAGREIAGISDLVAALQETHDHFEAAGCKASDHGILTPFGFAVQEEVVDPIFRKRMAGEPVGPAEVRDYMSFMLHAFGEMDAKSGWVMQLHIGAVRDYRDALFAQLGPDSGGDVSDHLVEIVAPLKDFLNVFDGRLKIVLYSLDPNHVPTLATLTRAFGAMVNLGAAWWFNDSPVGIKRQLETIASVDLLANFAGMVTDSRKLISYGSRTEMYRRVLADVIGAIIERGQMSEAVGIKLAKHVCYDGPKVFFGF